MSETIRLGSSEIKKGWASVGEQLQKQSQIKSTPLKLLTSPKTTAVLSATLLGLLHPATAGALVKGAVGKVAAKVAAHPIKTYTVGLLGAGALSVSPTLRETAKKYLSPKYIVGKGAYLGEKVEEIVGKKTADTTLGFGEKVKEGLKKAGLIGGAVAGAGAIALGVSKAVPYVKEKLAERKAKKEVGLISKDEAVPSPTLSHPYVQPQLAGYPQISPLEPAGAIKQAPPIQNIIQIQVQ